MDANQKSFLLQSQVRHNAEEFKNSVTDLYSWEKQMKDKEQVKTQPRPSGEATGATKISTDGATEKAAPVRSHVVPKEGRKSAQTATPATAVNFSIKQQNGTATEKVDIPTEKVENPIDPTEEKRRQANTIKDRGNEFVKQGEYLKALEAYTAAIDVYPEDPVFYNNRALCYLKLKKYYDCIEDCEHAIDIDPRSVKAYYRRMQANENLGNDIDAYKDCQTLLMIDPHNTEAKKSLERINKSLTSNFKSETGPNFCRVRSDMCFISPVEKPPHERSKKPLRRIPITDVVGPQKAKNRDNSSIQVSDDVIDKLFNSDCGPFVEVKKQEEDGEMEASSSNMSTTSSTITMKTVVKTPVKHQAAAAVDNIERPPESRVEAKKSKKSNAASTKTTPPPPAPTATAPAATATAAASTIQTTEPCSNKLIKTIIKEQPIGDSVEQQEATDLLKSANSNKPLPPAPVSTAQFYSNWKELSPPQKYEYLKSINTGKLCKILGAGFDSDTLTDILHTLRDFYVPHKEPSLCATLLEVSKNNQVGILSLLMSANDHKAISDVLNSLKENNEIVDRSAVDLIAKNFNLH